MLSPSLLFQSLHVLCCTRYLLMQHHLPEVMLFQNNSKPYHTTLNRNNKAPYYSTARKYLDHIVTISCKNEALLLVSRYKSDRLLQKQLPQHYYYRTIRLAYRVKKTSWSRLASPICELSQQSCQAHKHASLFQIRTSLSLVKVSHFSLLFLSILSAC